MKEETYVKLLDQFTYAVVILIIIYICLWILEYYNKPMIDMNKTVDCIHDKVIENKQFIEEKNNKQVQSKKNNKK